MIDIESIFRYKSPNSDKLLSYGFLCSDGIYTKAVPIMDNQFDIKVYITAEHINFKVFENDTQEEYILVHVPQAKGGFVGKIRKASEDILCEIAEKCFDTHTLKAEQTRRIINFIKENFETEPEFLWEKTPDCAVFRIKDNEKWFGIIMTIPRNKLGLKESGQIEVINLKDKPENIEAKLDGKNYFKAYHMNKKHWYTICLDGRISDEDIKAHITTSYNLVSKGKANVKKL